MAGPGYSFVAYPSAAEFAFAPGYPGSPHAASMSHHMELSGSQHMPYPAPHPHFPANMAFSNFGYPIQGSPPSPAATHPHPPSPKQQQAPSSPDRYSAEVKVMRQLCTAMTRLQNTMKDLAERQEQILDRMSLLEQRAGRMDDGIETLLESTEAILEENKVIRSKIENSESSRDYDACESRLTDLMDGLVGKLVGCIGEEIKEIKKVVKETERHAKFDHLANTTWNNKMMAAHNQQCVSDAALLGEEPQKELGVV